MALLLQPALELGLSVRDAELAGGAAAGVDARGDQARFVRDQAPAVGGQEQRLARPSAADLYRILRDESSSHLQRCRRETASEKSP
jgi:hypothetical protein